MKDGKENGSKMGQVREVLESAESMSLRDYFIGQAVLGILSNMNGVIVSKSVAHNACAVADAVLAERAKAGE